MLLVLLVLTLEFDFMSQPSRRASSHPRLAGIRAIENAAVLLAYSLSASSAARMALSQFVARLFRA